MCIRMTVSNRQRVALALAFQGPWSGDEDQLLLLDDAFEQFKLDDLDDAFKLGPDGRSLSMELPKGFDLDRDQWVEVSKDVAEMLLGRFPPAPTPAQYGRAKVKLLRELRRHVPKKTKAAEAGLGEPAPVEAAPQ